MKFASFPFHHVFLFLFFRFLANALSSGYVRNSWCKCWFKASYPCFHVKFQQNHFFSYSHTKANWENNRGNDSVNHWRTKRADHSETDCGQRNSKMHLIHRWRRKILYKLMVFKPNYSFTEVSSKYSYWFLAGTGNSTRAIIFLLYSLNPLNDQICNVFILTLITSIK